MLAVSTLVPGYIFGLLNSEIASLCQWVTKTLSGLQFGVQSQMCSDRLSNPLHFISIVILDTWLVTTTTNAFLDSIPSIAGNLQRIAMALATKIDGEWVVCSGNSALNPTPIQLPFCHADRRLRCRHASNVYR